jgi:hypothetical protein
MISWRSGSSDPSVLIKSVRVALISFCKRLFDWQANRYLIQVDVVPIEPVLLRFDIFTLKIQLGKLIVKI